MLRQLHLVSTICTNDAIDIFTERPLLQVVVCDAPKCNIEVAPELKFPCKYYGQVFNRQRQHTVSHQKQFWIIGPRVKCSDTQL